MLKLFRVTVVLLVAIISVTLIAMVFTAVLSSFPLPMISHTEGIAVVAGGVSESWLRLAFLLAVLVSAFVVYRRGRK